MVEQNNLIDKFFYGEEKGSHYINLNDYSKHWELLMPVCLKISTLTDYPKPILNGVESVYPYIMAMRKMKHGAIRFNINETFLGVVEFIKWYNQNKNI